MFIFHLVGIIACCENEIISTLLISLTVRATDSEPTGRPQLYFIIRQLELVAGAERSSGRRAMFPGVSFFNKSKFHLIH